MILPTRHPPGVPFTTMGDDEAPTEFAGVATDDTELAYAWSADDGEEWQPPRRSWRPVIAAVAASLFVAGVAGGIAVEHLRPEPVVVVADTPVRAAPEPEPTVAPKPTTTMPRAGWREGSPNAQTIEPPRPTVAVPVVLTPLDEQFLSILTGKWGFNIVNPSIAIQNAALVCKRLRSGIDLPQISQEMAAAATEYDVRSSHIFASEVLTTYPTCHMP